MNYTVNPDNTINVQAISFDNEYGRKLQEKFNTLNADQLLVECPEMFKFDGHKFGK